MQKGVSAYRSAYVLAVAMACCGLSLVLIGGCPTTPPPVGGCTANTECDDGIPCTVDVCDPTTGVCVNDPVSCQLIDLGTSSDAVIAALDVRSKITGITIGSPPVVDFTVTAANGSPITGIGALWEADNRFVRFTLTKLLPGTNGDPSVRVSYTRETTDDGSTGPNYDSGSSLVDHGDGAYTFTFNTDVGNVTGVTYEPTLSHRVAGQVGSADVPLAPQNLVLDFVPAGGDVTVTRNIATVASCNECHDGLVMHGRRFITEYCVNCHNPDLAQGEGDMKIMVHKIHSAQKFNVLDDGVDYSDVTYPQDLRNCQKCHNGEDAATPDGDNWKNVPSMQACGACHTTVNFATGENHVGGAQANNSVCALCHSATGIETSHVTDNATPNNPSVPAGAVNFTYEIASATVAGATNAATISFRILADGTPVVFGAPGTTLLEGFTGGPSFLFAYALPQQGLDNPADWNNLGQSAAQPQSISLTNIWDGTKGTLAGPNADGYYTATVPDGFPGGATMRAVALQAYFTQVDPALPRHTLSAVMTVTGDQTRRVVVDVNKCGKCHEWFEGHGGNRVVGLPLNPVEQTQPLVCALCHVPNLSASGRSIDPAKAADQDGDPNTVDPAAATVDLGTSDTWTWPENTNNLKDMIHGIHASAVRTSPFEFVRGRNNGLYFDFSEVTFPAQNGVRNCLLCHAEGTYQLPLSDNVLETTVRSTGTDDGLDGNDFNAVIAARSSVPNPTDWVSTPTASTCYKCHDSATALAHIRQNGGVISIADPAEASFTQRQNVDSVESCAVCHGEGKIADLIVVHQIK
jgi:OmcA/MtrC family decaheme c-type cytochrome